MPRLAILIILFYNDFNEIFSPFFPEMTAVYKQSLILTEGETNMLTVGIKGRQETIVSEANSAKTMGSGTLDVFATPSMIALMELTAWKSVAEHLDEGCGTVGTLLNVTHDAPTPFGMKVWCESELVEVDGRRLVFEVAAYDEKGKIGGGRHERFVIQNEKFQAKANKKGE